MALYSAQVELGGNPRHGIGNAGVELYTEATERPRIIEIGVTVSRVPSAQLWFGIGRPGAVGVGRIAPYPSANVGAEDPAEPASTVKLAVQWATAPTVPFGSAFFRRATCPLTVGAGVIFTFPQGLEIPLGGSIVIWNIQLGASTPAHYDFWAVVDE